MAVVTLNQIQKDQELDPAYVQAIKDYQKLMAGAGAGSGAGMMNNGLATSLTGNSTYQKLLAAVQKIIGKQSADERAIAQVLTGQ